MPVDRGRAMRNMALFADAGYMKTHFGITINASQKEAAEKELKYFRTAEDSDLKKTDEKYERRWPYALTETQRYDRLLFDAEIHLTISQSILWQNIRRERIKAGMPFLENAQAIAAALAEMEEFMQLNAYLGHFQDNADLVDDNTPDILLRLFANAYDRYSSDNAPQRKKTAEKKGNGHAENI